LGKSALPIQLMKIWLRTCKWQASKLLAQAACYFLIKSFYWTLISDNCSIFYMFHSMSLPMLLWQCGHNLYLYKNHNFAPDFVVLSFLKRNCIFLRPSGPLYTWNEKSWRKPLTGHGSSSRSQSFNLMAFGCSVKWEGATK
jgi:hypothetical protein